VPQRVEFTTDTQVSYLEDTDFTLLEGLYNSPVKNDSTVSTVNDSDTSRLYGRYILSKLIMAHGVYQSVRNIIMKVRLRTRQYNR